MMGDLIARGDAPNKKMAEKMCALDACVKLAQLGRLTYTPKSANRGGGGGSSSSGGGMRKHKGPAFAGDLGAVPLCTSRRFPTIVKVDEVRLDVVGERQCPRHAITFRHFATLGDKHLDILPPHAQLVAHQQLVIVPELRHRLVALLGQRLR